MSADIVTDGLECIGSPTGFPNHWYSVAEENDHGLTDIYEYRVTGAPGSVVSLNLRNVTAVSVNGTTATPATKGWSATVEIPITPPVADAQPIITGPGTLRPGDSIAIAVSRPDGFTDMSATSVETTGLSFSGVTGHGTASAGAIQSVGFGPLVYHYTVTAGPNERVSIRLSGVRLMSADMEYAGRDAAWSAVVSGSASVPDYAPQIMVEGPAFATTGDTVTVKFTCPDGYSQMDARLALSGLVVTEMSFTGRGMCSWDNISISRWSPQDRIDATYTCRITAPVGSSVSAALSDVTYSDGTYTYRPADTQWSIPVGSVSSTPSMDAVPVINGPTTVQKGDTIDLVVPALPLWTGWYADISTQGLEFIECYGFACTGRFLLSMGDTVVYRYRVTADLGTEVSFGLSGVTASTGEYDVSLPGTAEWRATVSGTAGPPSTTEAAPSVSGPGIVRENDLVTLTMDCPMPYDGMRGLIHVEGMQLVRVDPSYTSDGSSFNVQRNASGGGTRITYTYRVTAPAGSSISFVPNAVVFIHDRTEFAGNPACWSASVKPETSVGELQLKEGGGLALEWRDGSKWLTGLSLEDHSHIRAGSVAARFQTDAQASDSIRIRNAAGKILTDGSRIGTGCIIQLVGPAGVLDSAVVVVRGDVSGNGRASVAQAVAMTHALLEIDPLNGPYLAAGDWNGSGHIDLADLVREVSLIRESTAA